MNTTEIQDRFSTHNMRCEKIYPLFAICESGLESHALREEISEYDKSLWEALEINANVLSEHNNFDNYDDIECFLYENRKYGFLGKFAKPIARDFHEDKLSYNFSWGFYQTVWLYAETMEDLFAKAYTWAEERHRIDIKEDDERKAEKAKKQKVAER